MTERLSRSHIPAGAPLLPSGPGHPGPCVLQQLLPGLFHQLRPRGTCGVCWWVCASSFTRACLCLHGTCILSVPPLRPHACWIVTKGFRCKKLNSILTSSSPTSVHQIGYAADIYVGGGKTEMDKFGKFLVEYLKDKKFDQLLTEKSSSGGYWYHLGLRNNKNEQRCQIKNLFVR